MPPQALIPASNDQMKMDFQVFSPFEWKGFCSPDFKQTQTYLRWGWEERQVVKHSARSQKALGFKDHCTEKPPAP